MTRFTTIRLTEDTRDKLRQQGSKGETYDTIILRLIQRQ
jgi:hypothetical protein